VKFLVSLILRDEQHPDDLIGHMNELHRVYHNLLADIIDSGPARRASSARASPRASTPGIIMTALHGILLQGFRGNEAPEKPEALLQHLKTTLVDTLRR
jgi:hypothetical protein